ncbi:inhibitor of vertebrate lysozyme family protein [Paraburkholderia bonniea]|uniref:inhibitor of vertebrate lysozyme family protein n=1 Tax=Paraburkholderia bonniea TaxID=2152891 RepID=UPI001291588C|nr:inhibitor of vertebrate lysozyme family protein [Paraburkholderia bonniea]
MTLSKRLTGLTTLPGRTFKTLHRVALGFAIVAGACALPASAAPTTAAASATPAVFSELPEQKPYQAAWKAMLKNEKRVPSWISKARNATSSPYSTARIGNATYISGSMCKQHDCGNNRFLGLFSEDKRQAWGLQVTVKDTPDAVSTPSKFATYRWFGKPDAALKTYLTDQLKTDPDWK